jgi:hypothetical protein
MQQVFSAIQAEPGGLKRKVLLKKFRASNAPGSINSAVRRLVIAGALKAKLLEMTA